MKNEDAHFSASGCEYMYKLELFNQGDILYARYSQVVSPFHLAKKYVILTDSKT